MGSSRVAVTVSVLVAVLVAVFPFPVDRPAGAAPGSAPAGTPTAHRFAGTPTVGPLFPGGGSTHTCTASVVASPAGNLVVTAAHCLVGTAAGDTFAPGYHDGTEPFGTWTVVRAYASSRWTKGQAPGADVAFLVVAPRHIHGRRRSIQSVTGANRLGATPGRRLRVTVPAYPLGTGGRPVTCTARVRLHGATPAFDCTPYVDGTSGAPWLDHHGGTTSVVGLIGGVHQGGCEPWTSYSPRFGSLVHGVYEVAVRGGRASVLPVPKGDGCTTGL